MSLLQGFGDTLEAALLDKEFGAINYTPAVTHYIALYTASPGDAGPGTELSGGAYARVAVTNDQTTWSRSGGQVSNGIVITFPTPTIDWARATHFAVLASNVATEPRAYGELLGPGRVISAVDTGTDTLTASSHGFINGTRIKVRSTGTLPSPLAEATTYYVVGQTTHTLQLALTSGGAAVNLTDAGYGAHTVHEDKSVLGEAGNTVSIAIGGLVVTLD